MTIMQPAKINIAKEVKIKFRRNLMHWYKENKRSFPWRNSKDPYQILISEVLLQKTDAPKVLPVYKKFIKKYPTPEILQQAKLPELKKILKDLGLHYRAERLKSIGEDLCVLHEGKVPAQKDQLLRFKGLGEYASSAIMCFAYDKREAIVDNNVVRLFERIFGFKTSRVR